MKVIIAGSRSISDIDIVTSAISESGFEITTVVSGGAKGVDRLGEYWASCRLIPVDVFPADWDKYGKSAGYKRNVQMADNADALVAVWDGVSKGTKHMIDIATKKGLKIFIYEGNTRHRNNSCSTSCNREV